MSSGNEMNNDITPIIVDFPLRGEWIAPHTPGDKVPSHGTDMLGQRYAYDFMRLDWGKKGFKWFKKSKMAYFVVGVRLEDCYGWSQPIYSPIEGTVVVAKDGWPERKRLHLLTDLFVVFKNAFFFNPKKAGDFRQVCGNYIIIEGKEAYAFLAHARCNSIQVSVGDKVKPRQQLAEVGHSGNSTAPHLHFHLMDRVNLLEAQGIPCCFREYELRENGTWRKVFNGIPGKTDIIQY